MRFKLSPADQQKRREWLATRWRETKPGEFARRRDRTSGPQISLDVARIRQAAAMALKLGFDNLTMSRMLDLGMDADAIRTHFVRYGQTANQRR
jgi:hypothetical protein